MLMPQTKHPRLQIHQLVQIDVMAQFRDDVQRGLSHTPKFLYPKYFYDELGSHLFEAICLLPEYYLTRAEDEILERHADEIVRRVEVKPDGGIQLLELGSGSSRKTPRIIDALLRHLTSRGDPPGSLRYVPIDISQTALETSARVLLEMYPEISVAAHVSDYGSALAHLAEARAGKSTPRTLALFLGSNIGNFGAGEAPEFLRAVRRVLREGDALLIGADLRKETTVLEAAYDDALGVTAAFNLNLLARINRELAADFNPRQFRHVARYNEPAGRVEIHLESLCAQVVHLAKPDLTVRFDVGVVIHTENSHKYALSELNELAARTGYDCVRTWLDEAGQFSSNLFCAVAGTER